MRIEVSAKDSLFDVCIGLLGQERESLERLSERLKLEPEVDSKGAVSLYTFPEFGILVVYFELFEYFSSVHFFLDTPAVREGYVQAYSDVFLAGITAADSKEEVERKIGIVPKKWKQSGDDWQRYDLPNYFVDFIFDGERELMLSVAVKHKDTES
jgi:hypothetical protein